MNNRKPLYGALLCLILLGAAVGVRAVTKDPEISAATKYEFIRSVAIVNALQLALERSYTPDQRNIIVQLTALAPKQQAAQAKAQSECGASYEVAEVGETLVCRKKGPVKPAR